MQIMPTHFKITFDPVCLTVHTVFHLSNYLVEVYVDAPGYLCYLSVFHCLYQTVAVTVLLFPSMGSTLLRQNGAVPLSLSDFVSASTQTGFSGQVQSGSAPQEISGVTASESLPH